MSSSPALSGAEPLRATTAALRQVPAAAADDRGWGGIPYKWLVLVAVIFGLFMAILDSTVVNIALPKLQSVFGTYREAPAF